VTKIDQTCFLKCFTDEGVIISGTVQ